MNWQPPVIALSALHHDGIEKFWGAIENYRKALVPTGEFDARRRHQAQAWMWSLIDSGLRRAFHANLTVLAQLPAIKQAVDEARQTPASAARQLLGSFLPSSTAALGA